MAPEHSMFDRRSLVAAGLAATALLLTNRGRAASTALADLELSEASELVQRRRVSPVELTEACLDRIERLNPELNAFIRVTASAAMAQARDRAGELERGKSRGALHGIPLALKDNIDTAGVRTTAAAGGLAQRRPQTDAEVVRRLKAAGAVLLGKLNMDECAYGVSTSTGLFGPTHNPWKRGFIPGGSSGGAAAAVAARLCYGALGTDTGGSIRQPAAYCGVVGLKPSYGLVSTRGVVPLSWSLDHVGPLSRSALDAALLLQAIAGYDPADTTSKSMPAVDYVNAIEAKTGRLRLGRPTGSYFERLDPAVEYAVGEALTTLEDLTGGITAIELPRPPTLAVMFVEANSYFGPLVEKRPDGFSDAFKRMLAMGERISAARYAEALRELERVRRSVLRVFEEVDLLVTPTTPNLPMTIEQSLRPGEQSGAPASARNTTPFNIYGLPTVSVPCGFSDSGLPIGLQISGCPGDDGRVLALAARYQRVTDWHRCAPPIWSAGAHA